MTLTAALTSRTAVGRGLSALTVAALVLALTACVPIHRPDAKVPTGAFRHDGPTSVTTLLMARDGTVEFDNLPRRVLTNPVDSVALDWTDLVDVTGRWSKSSERVGDYEALDVVLPHKGAFPGAGLTLQYTASGRLFIYLSVEDDIKFVFTKQ